MWHLQRVLAKKRDPLSQTLFLDVAAPSEDDPLPLELFWWVRLGCLCFCWLAGWLAGGLAVAGWQVAAGAWLRQ